MSLLRELCILQRTFPLLRDRCVLRVTLFYCYGGDFLLLREVSSIEEAFVPFFEELKESPCPC